MVCLKSLEALHTVCLYRGYLEKPLELVDSFLSYADAYLYLKEHFHEFSSSWHYFLVGSYTYRVFDDESDEETKENS